MIPSTDTTRLIYQRAPGVRALRELSFARYPDVTAALRDPAFRPPSPAAISMTLFDGRAAFELNLVAAFVWSVLGRACSLDDVTDQVVATFDVDRQIARRDVEQLCEGLVRRGLVQV